MSEKVNGGTYMPKISIMKENLTGAQFEQDYCFIYCD